MPPAQQWGWVIITGTPKLDHTVPLCFISSLSQTLCHTVLKLIIIKKKKVSGQLAWHIPELERLA